MSAMAENEKQAECWKCMHRREIPGDCHIRCDFPPPRIIYVGAGGAERYTVAAGIAKEQECVVRCVWPGSGIYPHSFDGGTVFACSHFEERR